jgi:hypothetical protein
VTRLGRFVAVIAAAVVGLLVTLGALLVFRLVVPDSPLAVSWVVFFLALALFGVTTAGCYTRVVDGRIVRARRDQPLP